MIFNGYIKIIKNKSIILANQKKLVLHFSGDIQHFYPEYRPRIPEKLRFLGDIKHFYLEYRPKNEKHDI